MTRALFASFVLPCVFASARAFADDEQHGLTPGSSVAQQEPHADGSAGDAGTEEEIDEGPPDIPRRELPDYDGRPDRGPSAAEIGIWIPRVLLAPVYLVFEFLVRRPLGWIVTTGERDRWSILRIPPFAQRRSSWGITPTLLLDFGFQSSGGAYLWFNNALAQGNDIRIQLGFGGIDWWLASVLDRIHLAENLALEMNGTFSMRPDLLFVGTGPDASRTRQSRYGMTTVNGSVGLALRPWRASHLRVGVGVTSHDYFDPTYLREGELTVTEAVVQGWYPSLPAGFDGYVAYWQTIDLAIDTRQPRPENGSGIRFEARVRHAFDVTRVLERRWITWGGAIGGFWDVHEGRTFALWTFADFAAPLGVEPVPFNELPGLGGRGRMTAFRAGWLTGESVFTTSLEYRYPIWIAIDGLINVSVGNAFGPMFDGFSFERLRMSFSLGLRTVGDPDQSFTFQIGMGTDTFENGAAPVIFRLTMGTQEGF